MKEIIEAYFNERSLVNHQIGSYDDCIPSSGEKGDGKKPANESHGANCP